MNLVPYETFSYETDLSPRQVKRILKQVEAAFPVSIWHRPRAMTLFRVEFKGERFRLDLQDGAPAALLFSRVTGEIKPQEHGSTVKVSIKLNTFMLVLAIIWLGWIAMIGLILAVECVLNQNPTLEAFLFSGLFVVGYSCLLYAFRKQVFKSRKWIDALLSDETTNDTSSLENGW